MSGNRVVELLRLDEELETINILLERIPEERRYLVDRQVLLVAIIENGEKSDEGGGREPVWG